MSTISSNCLLPRSHSSFNHLPYHFIKKNVPKESYELKVILMMCLGVTSRQLKKFSVGGHFLTEHTLNVAYQPRPSPSRIKAKRKIINWFFQEKSVKKNPHVRQQKLFLNWQPLIVRHDRLEFMSLPLGYSFLIEWTSIDDWINCCSYDSSPSNHSKKKPKITHSVPLRFWLPKV